MFSSSFTISNLYHSAALESTALVTGNASLPAGGADLLGFIAENTSGSTVWFQIFDGHAAPAGASVPLVSIKATTGQQISFDSNVFHALHVADGIVIVTSTTGPTYTAAGSSSFISAFWK